MNLVETIQLEGHTGSVTAVEFSPDGKLMASGSWDKTIRIWDVVTGKEIGQLLGHTGRVTSVAFSPDGSMLASGGQDHTARLWDVNARKEMRKTDLLPHLGLRVGVAFSRDGKFVAAVDERKPRLFVVATGEEKNAFDDDTFGSMGLIGFSPDGKSAVTVEGNGLSLWDTIVGKRITSLFGHTEIISAVAFSPDGVLLASGSWDMTVRLWDMGKEKTKLDAGFSSVNAVAFRPNGRLLASASDDSIIRVWDIDAESEVCNVKLKVGSSNSLAFSPDGQLLASAGDDSTIRLWKLDENNLNA